MHCPLTGKPCIMPKEISITEVKDGKVEHQFMCQECGNQYIKELKNIDVVTKSLEVMSSNEGDVSYNEKLTNKHSLDTYEKELGQEEINEGQQLPPTQAPANPPLSTEQQAKAIEAKLSEAVDREDYKTASILRDMLKEFNEKYRNEN